MDVTDTITKMLKDYQNIDLKINTSVKYRCAYNNYRTDILYTQQDGLQNQLLLIIFAEGMAYLTTVVFSKSEDSRYQIKPYLPPELYNKIKFNVLLDQETRTCRTTPYFDALFNAINSNPLVCNHRNELSNHNLYQYRNDEDNPYFETTVRKKMSPDMRKKIFNKYDKPMSDIIIKYCGTTRTLRFTADINRSKDLETFIDNIPL